MCEKKKEEETSDEQKFSENYVDEFTRLYRTVKDHMPRDTPPEIIAVAIKDLKAALYYREKEIAKSTGMAPTDNSPMMFESMLNALDWKNGKGGSQWTFRTEKDGKLVESMRPLQGLLEQIKAKRYMVVGKWKYSVSGEGDKFLSRYPT